MQILVDNRPPELDPSDVGQSFREITRYLTSTMETIDFNLAKNRRSMIVSSGSAAGMQEQLDQIRAAIVVLTNSVNSISNQIGSMDSSLSGVNNDVASIKRDISEINEKLTDLEARVTALEQKQQGTP